MNASLKVGVCSKSFSKNIKLREMLLKQYADVRFNDMGVQLEEESLIEFLKDRDAAIIGLEKIDLDVLKKLPNLKIISKYGVGLDMIDLHAMAIEKRRLGWTAGVNKLAVAELALSYALILIRKTIISNKSLLNGVWSQAIGGLLSGKSIGIIGCGNVGKEFIRLLQPLGCKIISYDIEDYSEFYKEYHVTQSSMDYLLSKSDIISVHLPLNSSTSNLISYDEFSKMKDQVLIINTARGGIVNEVALFHFMRNGKVAGAAFDVFENEPAINNELLSLENFFGTPHIGGSAIEAIHNMGMAAISGLEENSVPNAENKK